MIMQRLIVYGNKHRRSGKHPFRMFPYVNPLYIPHPSAVAATFPRGEGLHMLNIIRFSRAS